MVTSVRDEQLPGNHDPKLGSLLVAVCQCVVVNIAGHIGRKSYGVERHVHRRRKRADVGEPQAPRHHSCEPGIVKCRPCAGTP